MSLKEFKIYSDTAGELIFWLATLFGVLLYFFSAPSGLPWSGSTELALAYGGRITELPEMTYPVWGYFIQVFGGHFVALSAVAAALAGGLIGAMANRYFGWRFGTAAALTWVMLPPVWDRAVTGAYGAFWMFGIVTALWLGNMLFLVVTRRARRNVATQGVENAQATLKGWKGMSWRARINRIAAWALLGASAVFAVVSASRHDYTVGEAASAYARVMLEEAGDRLVVLNGIADDQMVWEAEMRSPGSSERLVKYRNDTAYRTQLVARVRREFPGETNLWVSAQVGPGVLAEVVMEKHPDRTYAMTGQSTTPEKWAARWEAMKPYLDSSDRFLPVMRRAFAFEANMLGNRLQMDGKPKEAWDLYWRAVEEIDVKNVSAYVNLSEMLRRGYTTDEQKRKRIEAAMAELGKALASGRVAERAAAIVAACGPVMQDSKAMAEYRAAIEKRLRELEKEADKKDWKLPAELKTLIDWNNEMLRAHDRGDLAEASRIARIILSKRDWHGFVPANAVMGTVMSMEGDYVASEAFYRMAVAGKEKPPAVICNDYADTLMHLKRYDEAEKYARLAVAQTDEKEWICRLTLAEILREAKKNPDEAKKLVAGVLGHAPAEIGIRVRKAFGR